MPQITLNTSFSNPNLPTAKTLATQISEIASLVAWFQMDSNHLNVAGDEIISMSDRAGGAGSAVAASSYATLKADAIGSLTSAVFPGTTSGASCPYSLNGVDLDTDSDYTIVALFKPADTDNGDTIVGRFASSSERVLLNIPNGSNESVRLYHGTSAGIEHPVVANSWTLVVGAYDSVNALLKMYADGTTYSPVAATGTSGTSATITIGALNASGGQALDGEISDIMLFSSDLFQDAESLALVKKYFADIYGV